MITSCTIVAYDRHYEETDKRLRLTSCSNGMVEIEIENGLSSTIWVGVDDLKRAVENMANSNKLD